MSKLPQESFDSQLHIIRDARFDVDKYKVGELYVINAPLQAAYLHFGENSKTVAKLMSVDDHSLTFYTMKRLDAANNFLDIYNKYRVDEFTLSIDEIIEKQIEIERMLTETEAAMYLAGDVIEESTSAARGELLLGYGKASHDKYWNDLINREAQQDPIPTENNETDILIGNYVVYRGLHDVSSFYDPKSKKFTKDPFEGVKGTVKITMQKYKSEISMSTNIRNIRVVPEAIEIKNSCGTFLMVLTPASFNLMFDRIIFRAQQ